MLIKSKTLKGYKLDSLDGEMGNVKEFLFDDQNWIIRYLVADTGNWLPGRRVLISPKALVAAIQKEHHIAVDLTRSQIEASPPLGSDEPVSRQYEQALLNHYGWAPYWGTAPLVGSAPPPTMPPAQTVERKGSPKPSGDPHLRSTEHVIGYHIQATDGEIGHVEDFVIDDEVWANRYLIVDTRNWLPGRKVLLSTEWIERVSWKDSKVFLDLTQGAIKQAPDYTEDLLLTRDFEEELYGHYKRTGYWV